MEDLSIAIIVKNGAKTLPKLLKSLYGVKDIVVVSTGSTDNTVEVASAAGCNVTEVGDKFKIKVTKKNVADWKKMFGFEPSFKAGESYFHFGNARNYAASLTKNDWVFQPDADEEMDWDIDKVRRAIQVTDHLTYRFCYQHNEDGSCALEIQQSKLYRKSKLRWEKWVHEVLQKVPGERPKPPMYVDYIYHHHWQEAKAERGSQYLAGLELSVLDNPKDDRNHYYLSREYFYHGEYNKAIEFFTEFNKLGTWLPEKSQGFVYKGLSYKGLGNIDKAIECFHAAMISSDERREPFWELAVLYEGQKRLNRALVYLHSALAIPFTRQGYINNTELYGWKIPDKMAYIYNAIGDQENSKKYWLEALKHNPPRIVLENGIKWFYGDLPLISIVVPSIRPAGYERLLESITANTVYPNYEIINKNKDEGTAIEKFNQGVNESKGEFIAYMADDCEVELGWLTQAFVHFKENFRDRGLVIFNDNYWEDRMAHHFFCSKNIRDELGGNIWYEGYNHLGADNELYGRLTNMNLIEYCPQAKMKHHHYSVPSRGVKKGTYDKFAKRIEKNREVDQALLKKRSKEFGFKRIYLKKGEVEL